MHKIREVVITTEEQLSEISSKRGRGRKKKAREDRERRRKRVHRD
jgi:hypothetical protein